MDTQKSYGRYLDGKAMYSMGPQGKTVLTAEGWQVSPSHPATEHERMIGASEMRSAFQSMLQSGGLIPEEVARDVAHWLLLLNDGRATGIFVPLALAADGAPAIIDSATPEAIAARIDISARLENTGEISAGYVSAFLDALSRAERGRLTGLAAPFLSHAPMMDACQDRESEEQKRSKDTQPKVHIKYLALLHLKHPEATAKELRRCCVEDARNHQNIDNENFPFHIVSGDIALKGKQAAPSEKTFSNWFADAKKQI